MSNKEHYLHKVYWLWLPLLMFSTIVICGMTNYQAYDHYFNGELGIIELATPLVLFPAIIFGIVIFSDNKKVLDKNIKYCVLIITLACVYMAGEELSWGQHLWGWETPQWLMGANDQRETNLHNISSWFDQKPRLLLEIFVLVCGIFMPLYRMITGNDFQTYDWRYWLLPTETCLPVSILIILSKVPERIKEIFDLPTTVFAIPNAYETMKMVREFRYSEIQELFFAIFLALYLMSIRNRQKLSS